MAYDPKHPHCIQCGRTEATGARFAVRTDTKKLDDLCVKCRFDAIDGKHSHAKGIRADMRDAGVPIHGRSHSLRFEPGQDSAGGWTDEAEDSEE